MPSERKQLTEPRKRVTASARARISVKKTRKVVNNGMDGSYLRTDKETVSNADSVTGPSTLTNSNEAILAMLTEIKESNAVLARRMDRVEGNSSTPIYPRSHTSDQPPVSPQAGSPGIHRSGAGQIRGILASDATRQHYTQHSASNGAATFQPDIRVTQPLQGQAVGGQQSHPQYMGSLLQPHGQPDHSSDRSDAVIPGLQVLRSNPGIAESVNNLLASYESRAYSQLLQGKQNTTKRSGRYNAHDSITAAPHLRWPNEGYHASDGKKRVLYDDLSLPQWIAGQLTNIYAISDSILSKQALLQVIHAMRDAASLPWPTVRAAWASSMHQIEEGDLTWPNATQWAINRLSASQIALSHAQHSGPPISTRRTCKYFNEATCSHEGHHGSYSHFCSFCLKQGRQLSHPEARCNAKQKQGGRQQQAAS